VHYANICAFADGPDKPWHNGELRFKISCLFHRGRITCLYVCMVLCCYGQSLA